MRFTFTFLFTILLQFINAQTPRIFATQEADKRLRTENPDIVESRIQIERHVVQFIQTGEIRTVVIPVVFQIVSSPGNAPVTMPDIEAILTGLNRDFSTLDDQVYQLTEDWAAFSALAAIPKISFCIAEDPFHSSINTMNTIYSDWPTDDRIKKAGIGLPPIEPSSYLNIWVADLADSIGGYAQLPGGPLATDGIVIDRQFFINIAEGTNPYREGKTLTHLVGNYLGLQELWNAENPCFDDGVTDTPVHNASNAGVDLSGKHVSTCIDNPLEMTMNFMDDTDDAHMFMFTQGQVMRMQAMLAEGGPRYGLTLSAPCNPGGGLQPDQAQIINNHDSSGDALERPSLWVSPNPTQTQFNIQLHSINTSFVEVEVYATSGEKMWSQSGILDPGDTQWVVDCQQWPDALYMVVTRRGNTIETTSLIIAR